MSAPHYAELPTASRHYIDEASWNAIKSRFDSLGQTGLPAFSALPSTTKPYINQPSWDALVDEVGLLGGISGSDVLTFSVIADGASQALTFALIGAVIGDQVIPSWPSTLEAGLFGTMRVSAADTIEVRLANLTGANVTPAAGQTFGATVGIGSGLTTAPLTFAEIPDGGIGVGTFTLPGATVGQKVAPVWPSTLEAGLLGMMRVSASNTIEVRLANLTGANMTPVAAQVFGATVF